MIDSYFVVLIGSGSAGVVKGHYTCALMAEAEADRLNEEYLTPHTEFPPVGHVPYYDTLTLLEAVEAAGEFDVPTQKTIADCLKSRRSSYMSLTDRAYFDKVVVTASKAQLVRSINSHTLTIEFVDNSVGGFLDDTHTDHRRQPGILFCGGDNV